MANLLRILRSSWLIAYLETSTVRQSTEIRFKALTHCSGSIMKHEANLFSFTLMISQDSSTPRYWPSGRLKIALQRENFSKVPVSAYHFYNILYVVHRRCTADEGLLFRGASRLNDFPELKHLVCRYNKTSVARETSLRALGVSYDSLPDVHSGELAPDT